MQICKGIRGYPDLDWLSGTKIQVIYKECNLLWSYGKHNLSNGGYFDYQTLKLTWSSWEWHT